MSVEKPPLSEANPTQRDALASSPRKESVWRRLDPSWYVLLGVIGVAAGVSALSGFWGTCWGVLVGSPVAATSHLWMLHAAVSAARMGSGAGLQRVLVAALGRMGMGMAALLTVAVLYESAEALVGVLLALLADLVASGRDWSRNGKKA